MCFTAGTLIHTKAGLKPIEQIKAGDEVLSFNEQTKQTEYKAVLETYIRETNTIIKLEIESETKAIETTPEHPFYKRVHRARDGLSSNDDKGEWLEAGTLQIGDEVITPQGEWLKIVAVERERRSETVYNFTAADNHNYFVGERGTLVHNIDCTDLAKALKDKFGGGSVVRLTPKGNLPYLDVPKGMYPSGQGWFHHDVYINKGMVYDELSTFGKNNPIPFKDWWKMWENGAVTNIEKVKY